MHTTLIHSYEKGAGEIAFSILDARFRGYDAGRDSRKPSRTPASAEDVKMSRAEAQGASR